MCWQRRWRRTSGWTCQSAWFAKVFVDDVDIINTNVAGRWRRIRRLELRSSPRRQWWQSGGGN
jgi:hypothetical protein